MNPGCTFRIALNVRIISPAQTSNTSAIATCPTTRKFRARCRSRLALVVRPATARDNAVPRERPYFSAGTNPNNRPASTDNARPNSIVRQSTAISFNRGRFAGPIAIRTFTPPYANPIPSTPPIKPNITLSTSNARTIRTVPAPSAARTAISCWRDSPRTKNKFVTFAHAISITSAIVPITTQSVSLTFPITSSFNGRIAGVIFHDS